ncbi:hypothetical protein [Bradyrhizobium valentinum]|uniref:Uncharacterized protein n=1 Tax=Bradyrhizobium valentinum TaxID=1518501 RepID=A0A0R3LES9_9BRAD|nr:hypothetical protein [Bradyrhizobium valentinum]KRR04253.1 hypothetical protein CP49_23830 [Bradyrhizobium valentinum]
MASNIGQSADHLPPRVSRRPQLTLLSRRRGDRAKRGRIAGADRRPRWLLAGADDAYAQAKQTMPENVFAIAAVVDHFSDAVATNPIAGQKSKNAQLNIRRAVRRIRLPQAGQCAPKPSSAAGDGNSQQERD